MPVAAAVSLSPPASDVVPAEAAEAARPKSGIDMMRAPPRQKLDELLVRSPSGVPLPLLLALALALAWALALPRPSPTGRSLLVAFDRACGGGSFGDWCTDSALLAAGEGGTPVPLPPVVMLADDEDEPPRPMVVTSCSGGGSCACGALVLALVSAALTATPGDWATWKAEASTPPAPIIACEGDRSCNRGVDLGTSGLTGVL
jgi:hypothetical protein